MVGQWGGQKYNHIAEEIRVVQGGPWGLQGADLEVCLTLSLPPASLHTYFIPPFPVPVAGSYLRGDMGLPRPLICSSTAVPRPLCKGQEM